MNGNNQHGQHFEKKMPLPTIMRASTFLSNNELADLIVTSSYIRPPCAVVHNSECGEAGVLNFHSNIINMQGLLQELFKGAYP